jgi:DNA-binding NarL/FixJ family response regulator
VVADGAAIDRAGLASLLRTEAGFRVLGEAADTSEAIELCRTCAPQVLLLTVTLPNHSDEPAMDAIRAALPGQTIVAMSERGWSECVLTHGAAIGAHEDSRCGIGHDCMQWAAAQGAAGTLRRSADPATLFATIRAVAAGESMHEAAPEPRMALVGDDESGLPQRLLEVSHLLAEGRSNKEIAVALGITQPTVKKHVTRLLDRLGLHDRLQAGLFIARHPLLFAPRAAWRAERTAVHAA